METEKMSLLGVHVHSSIYSGHLVNVKEVDGLSQDINSKKEKNKVNKLIVTQY